MSRQEGAPGAEIRLAGSLEELRRMTLSDQVEEHFRRYGHILVQSSSTEVPFLSTARTIELADARAPGEGTPESRRLTGWAPAETPIRPDLDGGVNVPCLQPSDVASLRDGLLPPSTPAGRALGWAARDFAGLKVGLALGAGSLRGYAHFGVLRGSSAPASGTTTSPGRASAPPSAR